MLRPQHQPSPAAVSPHANWEYEPVASCVISDVLGTRTGLYAGLVYGKRFPSCPELFAPQHRTMPFERSPQLKLGPAETLTNAGLVGMAVGVLRWVVVPSPSCPLELIPQQ